MAAMTPRSIPPRKTPLFVFIADSLESGWRYAESPFWEQKEIVSSPVE